MPYVSSTLGTYSTGTVTVVNGSTAVTGSGTVWGDIVNEGDLFTIDDDKFYYVAALNSDTSLTLDKPYAESSASGINYRVMLNTAAHFPSDVAAKVERALSGMGDVYCPINHASSSSDYGLASASLYGHAKASGTTPKAPGTASVGTETNKFARGDHVHPHDDTKLDKTGGAFNKMFFSQTSGSYTAPYTGVYRITLKGGGGAGAFRNVGQNSTGGGGGEGATAIFYTTLTKNTSYAYTIGAGAQSGYAVDDGQGNISYVAPTDSGDTSIIINNSIFAVAGGKNAWTGGTSPQGGQGGYAFTLPGVTAERIYGASGSGGLYLPSGFGGNVPGASGGGNGGARGYTAGGATLNGQFGGGGAGMAYRNTQQSIDFYRGGNGGDGYILIEYAG